MNNTLSDDLGAYTERLPAYTERPTISYKDMDCKLDWLDWRAKDSLRTAFSIINAGIPLLPKTGFSFSKTLPMETWLKCLQQSITDDSC